MLVRYPSEIDLDRRKRHAPHIRVMMSAIRKGIDSREATYVCIETIFRYMLAIAEKMAEKDKDKLSKDMAERAEKMAEKRYGEEFGDMEGIDDGSKHK